MLLVAPRYGAEGAAMCSALSMILGNGVIMNFYYAYEMRLNILGFWKNALKVVAPLFAYAAMVYALVQTTSPSFNSWMNLIVGILLFTAGYVVVAYVAAMNGQEKNLIHTVFGDLRVLKKA